MISFRQRNLALAAVAAAAALTLPLEAMAQGKGTPGANGKSPVHDSGSLTTFSTGQGQGSSKGRAFLETQTSTCIPGGGAPCGLGPKTK
jgi:hypothetical protein